MRQLWACLWRWRVVGIFGRGSLAQVDTGSLGGGVAVRVECTYMWSAAAIGREISESFSIFSGLERKTAQLQTELHGDYQYLFRDTNSSGFSVLTR